MAGDTSATETSRRSSSSSSSAQLRPLAPRRAQWVEGAAWGEREDEEAVQAGSNGCCTRPNSGSCTLCGHGVSYRHRPWRRRWLVVHQPSRRGGRRRHRLGRDGGGKGDEACLAVPGRGVPHLKTGERRRLGYLLDAGDAAIRRCLGGGAVDGCPGGGDHGGVPRVDGLESGEHHRRSSDCRGRWRGARRGTTAPDPMAGLPESTAAGGAGGGAAALRSAPTSPVEITHGPEDTAASSTAPNGDGMEGSTWGGGTAAPSPAVAAPTAPEPSGGGGFPVAARPRSEGPPTGFAAGSPWPVAAPSIWGAGPSARVASSAGEDASGERIHVLDWGPGRGVGEGGRRC